MIVTQTTGPAVVSFASSLAGNACGSYWVFSEERLDSDFASLGEVMDASQTRYLYLFRIRLVLF